MTTPREALLRALNQPRRTGRPPGSVVPTLTAAGALLCPACRGECVTPQAENPWNGFKVEKMVLVGGKTVPCPHCQSVHYIPHALAKAHNAFWFPGDGEPTDGDD
jgi:hypothetical protein